MARLLVVDDEPDTAETLVLLLKVQGHDASSVSSGSIALESLDSSFDAVFLDVEMPDRSGIDVARALRRSLATLDVRIVFHSGLSQDNVRRGFSDYDHYLQKPSSPAELQACLARISRPRVIHQAFCLSVASERFTPDELRDIQDVSTRNNAARAITSYLMHGGGLIGQLIEGEEAAVLETAARIGSNDRHRDFRIVSIRTSAVRQCAPWWMECVHRPDQAAVLQAAHRRRGHEFVQAMSAAAVAASQSVR